MQNLLMNKSKTQLNCWDGFGRMQMMTEEEIIDCLKTTGLNEEFVVEFYEEMELFAKMVAEKATAELRSDVKINQKNLLQKLTRGQG